MRIERMKLEAETVTSPAVRDAIKAAKPFVTKPFNPKTGKGDRREILSGVHLKADGESGLTVEATDGKTAFRRVIPNCPITLDEVRRVKSAGYVGEEIAGKFPNLDLIVPGEFGSVFQIDKAEFLTLCDLCGKTQPRRSFSLAIAPGSHDAWIVRSNPENETGLPVNKPLTTRHGHPLDGVAYFHTEVIAKAVKASRTDEFGRVWVSTNGPRKPWFFSPCPLGEQAATGMDDWAIAMPVKPSEWEEIPK